MSRAVRWSGFSARRPARRGVLVVALDELLRSGTLIGGASSARRGRRVEALG